MGNLSSTRKVGQMRQDVSGALEAGEAALDMVIPEPVSALRQEVTIVDVGPRDGLQNESRLLPVSERVELVQRLVRAGLRHIEAGAFVAPRWVPQMAESAEVLKQALAETSAIPGVSLSALVPNHQGLAAARSTGVREIAVFAAASQSFSQRNINCSIAESLERFAPVCAEARHEGMRVRGYVSCVLGCPYEGEIGPGQVVEVVEGLVGLGCQEISLGDTIGVGTPGKVRQLLRAVSHVVPLSRIAVHFHDTYGQAVANVFAALETGVATVDSAVAGLGGCPYAPGASGNVATEEVVYLLEGLGVRTGIDLGSLVETGLWVCALLERPYGSKTGRACAARRGGPLRK